ncbi:Pyridoxal-5'-phosphate-dependent protein beta subunit [Kribbella flavida DSM 17836]|uniref:threonine ammonia-lyase n=1 Tax=Kribbella flavida (strain DSM 17836 / JCM 10339 / NBRC 14399) TaxID=479435 RepID=D2PQC4_KRIFD|nr:pyridoxal-phosphate dependent enzyme [Kribbella flavida]ADB34826.1 Pyridoxal-5'-phosphate-dependent protein beta subunit [Kribbella flavida DSM 17836]
MSEQTTEAPSPAEVAARSERVTPRLRQHLPVTPLVRFGAFSEELRAEVLVKCEHQQRTGSFKARGALAKLLPLTDEQRARGVVTASTGNHALGVGNALAALGGRGIVYLPENASPSKVAALRRFGLEIRAEGTDSGVLEPKARAYAAEHGLTYVSPYNDLDIVAGQGTVGVEILEQLSGRALDAVVVAVGGGGLVSGVASVLKKHRPGIRVYGASPAGDAAMAASVEAGEIVQVDGRHTLSDGTAGSVEPGSITFGLCRDLVDDWVLVSEDAISAALRTVIDTEHQLVEGSAAMAFAAARARRTELEGQRVAIVSCGGNISSSTLVAALA